MKLKYRDYSQVRDDIGEGFLVLKRGRGRPSPFVRIFSNNPYTHSMVCSWKWSHHPKDNSYTRDILEVVEFRELYGSRTTNLSEYVKKDSGLLDVFRLPERIQIFDSEHLNGYWKKFDPLTFTNNMRRATGQGYHWLTILKMFLFHTPAKIFMKFAHNDELESTHRICSSSMSYYLRQTFVDPLQYRADDFMQPSDWASIPITNYLWTLTDG
jgi:hypothetical protein